MIDLAKCPACRRRVSVKAPSCPKCGEPLSGNWAEVQIKKEGKVNLLIVAISFSILAVPFACSKQSKAYAQERLPRSCWAANEPIPASCQGEVDSDLFPFCPTEEIYEQTHNMMPYKTAAYGCETDVKGRMVKVLSCSYKTCKYSLYYGYDKWVTMWSQAGVVVK